MSKEQAGLKGSESTPINKRKYAELLARMRATDQKFPCNQFGSVNLAWVAKQIGCTNKVLEPGGSLHNQFMADVEKIGLEAKKHSDSKLQQKAEDAKRESSALKRDLAIRTKERDELSDEVRRLKDKIRRLESHQKEEELCLEELFKSGRRFTLG